MSAAKQPTIIYTLTDEAPLLATYAFLPVIRAFADAAGIDVKTSDISVAARILAEFGDHLTDEQRVPDNLAELGEMTQLPDTNIIKLPNISASVPQLLAAIKELKAKGYDLPDYPGEPKTDEEREIKQRYAKILGSAVNPVLREGNSDRRAPKAVKEYARKHPHSMSKWSQASRTHVATMKTGDFYHGEKTMTLDKARKVKMVLETKSGETLVLKPEVKLDEGDVIDSMFMSKKALCDFYEEQMEDAYKTGVMFSLHVKATMMKVSHPIVFGHAVKIFYKDAFAKHQKLFDELDVNVNNGLSDLYDKIESLPASQHEEIIRDLHACHEHRPELAMVDSAKGISNFHSPSDVIVDASMPAMIRLGGKMYGADGRTKDTKAVNPESTFSRIYQEIVNFCKTHGQFDPTTMGTVPNVGLMAQQGRGVRQPRQDLRDSRGRHRQHRRHRHGRGAADAERGRRRHLAHARRQGRADPRLGEAGRHAGARVRHAGGVLAGSGASARERTAQEGQHLPRRSRHRGPRHLDHERRNGPCGTRSSARCAGRTPSPRRATSCATT